MAAKKARVVFDCNIYVQALLNSESPAATCLALVWSGAVLSFVSPQTLAELKEVLARRFMAQKFHAKPEQLQIFQERVAATATQLRHSAAKFDFARDPKDAPYINLAIAAQADYIVTRDKDLLDLMTGHNDECKEFRQRFRPLKIVGPVEFLHAFLPTETQEM